MFKYEYCQIVFAFHVDKLRLEPEVGHTTHSKPWGVMILSGKSIAFNAIAYVSRI